MRCIQIVFLPPVTPICWCVGNVELSASLWPNFF